MIRGSDILAFICRLMKIFMPTLVTGMSRWPLQQNKIMLVESDSTPLYSAEVAQPSTSSFGQLSNLHQTCVLVRRSSDIPYCVFAGVGVIHVHAIAL